METTKLSSKGQLVIPKRVRDAVQAKIGTLFSVRVEGRRIVLETARKKLASKSLDAIVVNDVSREGVGFDSDRNAVTIISHDEVIEVPETSKWEVAQRVLDQVVKLCKRSGVASRS